MSYDNIYNTFLISVSFNSHVVIMEYCAHCLFNANKDYDTHN